MRKSKLMILFAFVFILSVFVACGTGSNEVSPSYNSSASNNDSSSSNNDSTSSNNDAVENSDDHEASGDYSWNSSEVIQIVLNRNSITADSGEVTINGSKVTITSAGTYSISGSLTDGQIIVNTSSDAIVRMILNGVDIGNSTGAPIYVKSAQKTIIVLADHTENYVADGYSYIFENSDDDEPNAAIFSKSDLTIYGDGSLTVDGNYNDGIAGKDGLIIKSGTIAVNAVDDGIRGKDYLVVKDGNITVNAGGDGLKSDNDEDAAKGYISIENGVIEIDSQGDAITAQTDLIIADGELLLSSGGGSNSRISEDASAKGLKAAVGIIIDGAAIAVDSADDAVHSNGTLTINGGSFDIASGDDGIHADSSLEINGGDISITKSFEGIESRTVITINNGDIHIVSSDDGLNVAGGKDASGRGAMPRFESSGDYYLYINGGYIAIEAVGDGIDVNGPIEMTGGDVIINGPTSNANGALDYTGSFIITGGFLLGAGSSGMAQIPGSSSTQCSVLINFRSAQPAGNLVHLRTTSGQEIFTFKPKKTYQSIAFSSSELTIGSTYKVYLGGTSSGTVTDSLYQGGTYSPGSQYASFTIYSVTTNVR